MSMDLYSHKTQYNTSLFFYAILATLCDFLLFYIVCLLKCMQNKCMQNKSFRNSVEIKITRLHINF